MTDSTQYNWTDPIGELSRDWAHEIAKAIPDDYSVTFKPWSPNRSAMADGRHGVMIEYSEWKDGETAASGSVKILTYVAVCVRHDDTREVGVQVYSGTGSGTRGVSRKWLAPRDGRDEETYLGPLLEAIGVWAFAARREVAARIR